MIKLLVGLGNPGPEYEHTRHNAGFWWVDEAARGLGLNLQAERAYFGRVARADRRALPASLNVGAAPADGPLWLLQPQTFMNLSGKSVAALARFFKVEPAEILVIHDELDLPAGQMKLKFGGSHAGHNGLRDIHAQLGTADYWRLRLGIGHPGDKAEVVNYVLRKPPSDERKAIEQCILDSMPALGLLLAGEMEKAMMRLHVKVPKAPKPLKPPAAPAASASVTAATVPKPATATASAQTPGLNEPQ